MVTVNDINEKHNELDGIKKVIKAKKRRLRAIKNRVIYPIMFLSILTGSAIAISTGFNPFSRIDEKDKYVYEEIDNQGNDIESILDHKLHSHDKSYQISVSIYSKWNYEDGIYKREVNNYSFDFDENLRLLLKKKINSITQDDIDTLKYDKNEINIETAYSLSQEELNKKDYISVSMNHIGEKIEFYQTFGQNTLDILYTILMSFLFETAYTCIYSLLFGKKFDQIIFTVNYEEKQLEIKYETLEKELKRLIEQKEQEEEDNRIRKIIHGR